MANLRIVDVVKKFEGGTDDNIELWLDRFHVAIDITTKTTTDDEKEKEMAKIMPLFLDGAAYNTWKQLGDADRKDLKKVESALRRVFGRSKATAWHALKTLQLVHGDSVDVAVEEVKSLLRTISGDDPPGELVSMFILDALPGTIADQVRLTCGEHMRLTEVSSAAKSLLTVVPGMSQASAAARRPLDSVRNEDRQLRCFGCRRLGHRRKDCNTVCFRCGKTGHLRRFCEDAATGTGNERAGAAFSDREASAEQH
jgi:hypothetical protein